MGGVEVAVVLELPAPRGGGVEVLPPETGFGEAEVPSGAAGVGHGAGGEVGDAVGGVVEGGGEEHGGTGGEE